MQTGVFYLFWISVLVWYCEVTFSLIIFHNVTFVFANINVLDAIACYVFLMCFYLPTNLYMCFNTYLAE